MGWLSTNPASSGQHPLSGAVKLLPSCTYVKQSDMFTRYEKQSGPVDGPGAPTTDGGPGEPAVNDVSGPGASAGAWAFTTATRKTAVATSINVVALVVPMVLVLQQLGL